MAETATVGILKTMLTMDTSSYDAGTKKAASGAASVKATLANLKDEVQKLTPLAERMVRGFGGDKLLHTANSLTAAVTKLGGAQKLTDAEQSRVNKTLGDAIAKYQRLGQEAPKAMVDLEKATRRAGGGTDFLSLKMVALGAAAGAFGAQLLGSAIRGVINLGKEAFTSAGHILDLKNATGLSVKTIQEMQFVAGQTGTSLESFTNAAFKLGAAIAGGGSSVKAALRDLGIEWEKIRGLSMDKQWDLVVEALGRVTNEGERNRLGIALMGKTFRDNAAAIGEGYRDMANQAKTSTEAQLKELDRLNDEWDKFKRNLQTGIGSELGRIVEEWRVTKEVNMEAAAAVRSGKGADLPFGLSDADLREEVQRRIANARRVDIALTKEQAVTNIEYAQRLREATAELTKLDAAERKQIAAAQTLGAAQDDLVAMLVRFGVDADKAEDALKIYSGTMKTATKDSKDLAKSQKELADAAAHAAEIWFDVQVQMDRAMLARQRSQMTILGDLGPKSAEEHIADLRRNLDAITHLSPLEIFGDLVPQAETAESLIAQMTRDLEAFEAPGRRAGEIMRDLFSPLFSGVVGGVSDLIFGRGDSGAREAERNFERLKKSGTVSAEELTRAFRAVKDSQRSMWDSFTQGVMDTLKNLLNYFVNSFLQGMVRAIAGTAFGQAAGRAMSSVLGLSGSGVMASVLGIGGGAGASILGAGAAPTTAALLGAAPVGAGAAGGAAAGGGLGATAAALATNPFTIAAAAGIGGVLLLNHFLGPGNTDPRKSFGGGPWRAVQAKKAAAFAAPSFMVPSMPAVSVPSSNVAVERQGVSGDRTVVFHINSFDPRSVRQIVTSKEVTDSIAHAFENNTGLVASRVGRALRP